MELVADYLFTRYIGKQKPLPFPEYLLPQNRHRNDFWITLEGECIHPWEMENRHLLNTVKMIHRSNLKIKQLYIEAGSDEHIIYGKAPWTTKKGRKLKGNNTMTLYFELWDKFRIYMLLRREVKLRGLEDHLI